MCPRQEGDAVHPVCSLLGGRASPASGPCPGWGALSSRAALLVVRTRRGTEGTAEAPSHRDTCAQVLSYSLCPHTRRPWKRRFALEPSDFSSVEPVPPPASRGPGRWRALAGPWGQGGVDTLTLTHSAGTRTNSNHSVAAWRTWPEAGPARRSRCPTRPRRALSASGQSCRPSGSHTSARQAGGWEGRPGPALPALGPPGTTSFIISTHSAAAKRAKPAAPPPQGDADFTQ